MGVDAFGVFSIGLAAVLVGSAAARWGLDQILLRELASNTLDENLRVVAGRFRAAEKLVLLGSIATTVAAIVIGLGILYFQGLNWKQMAVIFILALAIAPSALTFFLCECFRARGQQIIGTIGQSVAVPLLALTGLILAAKVINAEGIDTAAAISYAIACAAVFVIAKLMFYKLNKEVVNAGIGYVEGLGTLYKKATPLALATIITTWLGFSEIFFLGLLADSSSLGAYSAAARVVFVFGFITVVINNIVSPKIARCYSNGKKEEITKIIATSAMSGLLLALPLLLIIILFSAEILNIFGAEFVGAKTALKILAVGNFLLVGVGAIGVSLIMIGRDRQYLRIIFATVLFNCCVSPVLIIHFVEVGAAFSAITTILFANTLCFLSLRDGLKGKGFGSA